MALGTIAAGLAAMGAAIGGGVGDGILVGHAVGSIARQPGLQNRLQATVFIGVGLIGAMPTIAVVIGFFAMNK